MHPVPYTTACHNKAHHHLYNFKLKILLFKINSAIPLHGSIQLHCAVTKIVSFILDVCIFTLHKMTACSPDVSSSGPVPVQSPAAPIRSACLDFLCMETFMGEG